MRSQLKKNNVISGANHADSLGLEDIQKGIQSDKGKSSVIEPSLPFTFQEDINRYNQRWLPLLYGTLFSAYQVRDQIQQGNYTAATLFAASLSARLMSFFKLPTTASGIQNSLSRFLSLFPPLVTLSGLGLSLLNEPEAIAIFMMAYVLPLAMITLIQRITFTIMQLCDINNKALRDSGYFFSELTGCHVLMPMIDDSATPFLRTSWFNRLIKNYEMLKAQYAADRNGLLRVANGIDNISDVTALERANSNYFEHSLSRFQQSVRSFVQLFGASDFTGSATNVPCFSTHVGHLTVEPITAFLPTILGSAAAITTANPLFMALGLLSSSFFAKAAVPSTVAMIPVGELMTGGDCITLNRAGTLAFVADYASGIKIINVTNPQTPVLLGEVVITDRTKYQIKLNQAETLVFLTAQFARIYVVDVTLPLLPRLLTSIGVADEALLGMAINQDSTLLFVASYSGGLKIFNIYTPSSPVLILTVPTTGASYEVALNPTETLAFVADYKNGLQVVKVANILSAAIIASVAADGAKGVIINRQGSLVFVADVYGLEIFDVTTPSSPRRVSRVVTNGAFQVVLNQDETLAFILTSNSINVVNVVNPLFPVLLTTVPKRPVDIAVRSLVFVLYSDRLMIFKGSMRNIPATALTLNISTISTISTLERVRGLTLNKAGTLMFVINSNFLGHYYLEICNITFPYSPVRVGSESLDSQMVPYQVALNQAETLLFMFDGRKSINVLNVAIPSSPALLLPALLTANYALKSVVVSQKGNWVFALNNDYYGSGELKVFNVSRQWPFPVAGVRIFNAQVFVLNQAETLAFVANSTHVNIVNVTIPSSPVLLATLHIGIGIYYIKSNARGTLVFCAGGGLKVIDTSVPSSPALLATLSTGVSALTLNQDETLAFVTDFDGLKLIDVSNPKLPFIVQTLAISRSADVAVTPDESWGFVRKYRDEDGYSDITVVQISHAYLAIPVSSNDLMNDKAILRVGVLMEGQTYFFNQSSEQAYPTINQVYQIDQLGEKSELPSWFIFSPLSYQFYGVAPKGWTGKTLMVMTEIVEDAKTNYVWFRIEVASSLSITVGDTITLSSPSTIVSVSLQLANISAGQFVIKPAGFGAVAASVDAAGGRLSALGVIQDLNALFRQIAFNVSDRLLNNSLVSIAVDDTVNIPQEVSVPLTCFKVLQPPVFHSKLGFLNHTAKALRSFSYSIPAGSFTDSYGLELTYQATVPVEMSWLSFDPLTTQFSGTPPLNTARQLFHFVITASNLYRSTSANWTLQIADVHTPIVNNTLTGTTAFMNQDFYYTLRDKKAFVSVDGFELSYSASALPNWLEFSAQGTFTGKPGSTDLKNYVVNITATDPTGQTSQFFTIHVERAPFDQFLYLLSILGPIASGLLTAYSVYMQQGLIRNIWTGKKYVAPEDCFVASADGNFRYKIETDRSQVKEIKMFREITPESQIAQTLYPCIRDCMSYHLYGLLTLNPLIGKDGWLDDVKYDEETHSIIIRQALKGRLRERMVIHILDRDRAILKELPLDFFREPTGRQLTSEEQDMTIELQRSLLPQSDSIPAAVAGGGAAAGSFTGLEVEESDCFSDRLSDQDEEVEMQARTERSSFIASSQVSFFFQPRAHQPPNNDDSHSIDSDSIASISERELL